MKKTLLTSSVLMLSLSVSAAPTPNDPKKQTPQGLYVDSKEAYEMLQTDPTAILVDVRTPEEWQFVGHTHLAKIMIPSVLFDYTQYDEKKLRYKSVSNSQFISQFEEAAAKLNASEESKYILMCRSGSSRAQPAAKMLDQYGYKNIYVMTDGFEGSKTKRGDKKGFRLENGWKNSNLPWTYKIQIPK
ncbi:rhodanese-like domain-containing protein [Thiomicrorhabdus indica]|uniref:rhodanese-like domain-containing protein n=1 Tax=Thiomicrorhabdus indica TaxID=2267253 RepID=UPI00102DF142|nr:rhodanese-like domain-containing protein [Thiomicrorhabdus indica]